VLPVFRRSEDYHGGSNTWHGAGGEWRVEKQRLKWKILETFSQAAQQTGIPATDDFNRGDNTGVGYFDVNQKSGIRWNASKAFLRAAMKRPNLTTITGAHTQRLVFEGKRCVGVEYRGADVDYVAKARCEVILSAGAVNSPQLLELSGVGNGARLQRLGIDVVRDLRGVGENLQDHLQLRMAYKVNGVRTLNTLSAHWWGKLFIGLQYALMRSGPMSMAPSQLGAFAKSNPHDKSITRPDVAFTASVCNLRPSSRGSVHIASPDAHAAPLIAPNYLSADRDREVAANALRLTRRIVAAPALARYAPEEILPGIAFQTDEQLAEAAGNIGTTIFHPVGTCRMGTDNDPAAVVDSRLRVIGLRGLRVVDASVMPLITSGNTNSPTLMIAERASDMIREDRRSVETQEVIATALA
jgi:choline dehydrogenase